MVREEGGLKVVGWGDAGLNRLSAAKPFRAPFDSQSAFGLGCGTVT